MRVAVALAVVVIAGGCRPSTEPAPEPITVAPVPNEPGPSEPKPAVEPIPEPPSRDGWTAALDSSACELACADVYACLVLDGDERAAATIELGCLDACVRAPGAFATCERPSPIAADSCASYLACARGVWPSEDRPATVVDAGPDGCELGCKALARCYGAPDDAAEGCARQCREALDRDLQRVAAECSKLEGCAAIERCMTSLPGA